MKVESISIRNFRRLEGVDIAVEERDTVFVGANNSGKTSATAVFRCFLGQRSFRIHDFTASKLLDLDAFGRDGNPDLLPAIELDIWFQVDPEKVEFGRAFTLLPNLSADFKRLGVRLRYGSAKPDKMLAAYRSAYPSVGEKAPTKLMSEFLAQDGVLSQYFDIAYASLENVSGKLVPTPLNQSEGKKLLQTLIQVKFIDAQRNIDDDEASRSTRLSYAFANFYQANLEQPQFAAEAHKVVDENNQGLTKHYEKQFSSLLTMLKGLGVPSINDRDLKIVSTLSPEEALKGNTDLLYVDPATKHELPELYNGLGFKNLIYMAIQAKDFHSQWARTEENRPLCLLIFIEEPEVHLHAQVQQTFIRNMWEVIKASAIAEQVDDLMPQLLVTTHSSHVLDATDFGSVRYFRRCPLKEQDQKTAKVLNATQVHSLRDFLPTAVAVDGQVATQEQALAFLKRYLRVTHCDLFFADAAILVEGAAEKLLVPEMINKVASKLGSSYLTILEIGGAFVHRFDGLLEFLRIPYLIITDLDSVSHDGHHAVCRGDTPNAITSNASIKALLNVTSVAELIALTPDKKTGPGAVRYITFQQGVEVEIGGAKKTFVPRTLEEAFAYENLKFIRSGELPIGVDVPEDLEQAYQTVFKHVKSDSFKKTDFAMAVLSRQVEWVVPNYIKEGLCWLEGKLHGPMVSPKVPG